MSLTPQEQKVILEEAERAKEMRFCRRIETWIGGQLTGIDFEFKTDKDQLKNRLTGK